VIFDPGKSSFFTAVKPCANGILAAFPIGFSELRALEEPLCLCGRTMPYCIQERSLNQEVRGIVVLADDGDAHQVLSEELSIGRTGRARALEVDAIVPRRAGARLGPPPLAAR